MRQSAFGPYSAGPPKLSSRTNRPELAMQLAVSATAGEGPHAIQGGVGSPLLRRNAGLNSLDW